MPLIDKLSYVCSVPKLIIMTTNKLNPENWIKVHYNYLFSYAISRINKASVVEDIIQETLYSGLKSLHNYEGRANERTWLTSILRRKIFDHYRLINSRITASSIGSNSDQFFIFLI